MPIENVQGITYGELRPRKRIDEANTGDARIGGFPVYPNLMRELCDPDGDPAIRHARELHLCAVFSAWAYSDAVTLSSIAVRMGLEKNRVRKTVVVNDSMFVRSTAYVIQSENGAVAFLVYRGTEPFELATWATDADVKAVAVKVPGTDDATVHGGFYRNQRATWFDVVASLDQAGTGKSILNRNNYGTLVKADRIVGECPGYEPIGPLQRLYVTGHSLGGAMALLAAYRLLSDAAYGDFRDTLQGLYTFGQPMVGNPAFARLCRDQERFPFFANAYFRCVYERDVVPHLPPLLSGPHEHFGTLLVSDGVDDATPLWTPSNSATKQVRSFTAMLAAATDVIVEQIPLWRDIASVARRMPILRQSDLIYSFYDHSPAYYVSTSQPPGVVSELGDF